jgi:hypothetical protein
MEVKNGLKVHPKINIIPCFHIFVQVENHVKHRDTFMDRGEQSTSKWTSLCHDMILCIKFVTIKMTGQAERVAEPSDRLLGKL